ncbi:MAG: thermonuclease family protein [Desulfobacterales bacterium]|nr:thermonuclease family protein [Desulfobacterales bacterium]
MVETWIAAGAVRMLRPAATLLSLVVILMLLPAWERAGADGCERVVRVYDGDTLLLAEAGGRRRLVRLVGIDAPETSKTKGEAGQPFSVRARRHLTDRILERCVQLDAHGDDRYGRLLAVIHLEGTNINLEMVRLGLAEHYGGRTPEGFDRHPYRKAESEARRNARGMWVQGKHYRSPLDWKHRR